MAVSLGLVACDIVQRIVISPWVKLRPGRRLSVLGGWQRFLAGFVLGSVSRIGGAKIPPPPARIPAAPGQLILMNHQSLFDIPLVVKTIEGGYPRIVTRARYSRFIPLISHMTRLYQYPTVDPSANRAELAKTLEMLERAGKESDVPLVVFPEGHRTRDGKILRFRPSGLARLLAARDWTVHVLIADGFWKSARFVDLMDGMGHLEGKFVYAAKMEWRDPTADPGPFLKEVHRTMTRTLAELRGAAAPA